MYATIGGNPSKIPISERVGASSPNRHRYPIRGRAVASGGEFPKARHAHIWQWTLPFLVNLLIDSAGRTFFLLDVL